MKISYPLEKFLRRAADDNRLFPSHISLFMAMFYYSPERSPHADFQVSRRKLMYFATFKRLEKLHQESHYASIAEVARRILSNQQIKLYYTDISMNAPMEEMARENSIRLFDEQIYEHSFCHQVQALRVC